MFCTCRATRQVKDFDVELATDQSKIDALIRQIDSIGYEVRQEPLGHDRHWNRYWVLGAWHADEPGEKGLSLSVIV